MNHPRSSIQDASPAHRSQQLFSNHFLAERLREDELWENVADEAEALRSELRDRLTKQDDALSGANEDQTEERWIKPVLDALGWGYEVQPVSKRHGTVQYPDYALFLSQAQADGAAAEDRRRLLKRSDGVLEAKRWERDLDAGDPEYEEINRVPSTQIINYLTRAGQPWGILTNGAEWRLYYRDADFADTSYFAVDLPALLSDEPMSIGERAETISPEEAFRYFYLFFRPEAFRIEAEEKRWLDLAYGRSTRYARAVEEALKPRAYRAVEALCRGFVVAHDIHPSEVEENDELADTLLDNALTLLFRLLFLHYAESRDLLPVRTNPAYRRKSLLTLRERAAEQRESGEPFFPQGRDYWNDLHDLFQIVNGDPEWQAVGVPVYNGGLFDPNKHPWLEDHYVADPQLAEALDLLSRTQDPETGELHYVDYGPLDVRNLGSIYEGLLEHKLRVAEQEQPAVRTDGRTVRDAVDEGELYLANEEGERKVTGSFYTPDYVVEYIVENTLEPLVERRGPSEILELTVLDPAMGSGHFLVSATSYLARAAVRAVEEGEQQLLGEFAELDPEQLRRLVVERCIFGVDKNPRAVELAKLSLWIATVQMGKPLNFLDHHLKQGDSLLGARVSQLGGLPGRSSDAAALEAAGQLNAFERAFRQQLDRVLDLTHSIEHLFSDSLEDVQHKEDLYRDVNTLLDQFRAVANLWCSALLGNEPLFEEDDRGNDRSGDRYARAVQTLRAPPSEWEELQQEPWFREAQELGDQHDFFHWEVEFSEVFYEEEGGEREDPGFDAVIGNPPYVRMEEFRGLKPFLQELYATHSGGTDLFVYFMERSLQLLREGGRYGVIVSNKFLRARYGKKIRQLIGERAGVEEIVDFGGLPVFPDATVRAAVLLMALGERAEAPTLSRIQSLDFDALDTAVEETEIQLVHGATTGERWSLVAQEVQEVLEKLAAGAERLGSELSIHNGIKTGYNRAFFISGDERQAIIEQDSASKKLIVPYLRGRDLAAWTPEFSDQWMLLLKSSSDHSWPWANEDEDAEEVFRETYPGAYTHMKKHEKDLRKRTDQGRYWWELRSCDYYEVFTEPKIIYPEIAPESRFGMDREGRFTNNKCFVIPGEPYTLLSLLNSRLAFFYFRQMLAKLEGRTSDHEYLEFRQQYMDELPIPRVPENLPPEQRQDLVDKLINRYEESDLSTLDPYAEVVKRAAALIRDRVAEEGEQAAATEILWDFVGYLATEMIRLHEQRLDEIDTFLDWLEDQLGCAVDDLSGKTYVRAYYEQPEGVDKLLETIEKNRPSTTKLDVRKPEEYGEENPERDRVTSGYRRSMDTLQPILDQLDLTDELIDQIVYRLYGLTDEEVAVVEEYVG